MSRDIEDVIDKINELSCKLSKMDGYLEVSYRYNMDILITILNEIRDINFRISKIEKEKN